MTDTWPVEVLKGAPRVVKKRGRPRNASSIDTRARLIESGRRHFARYGFDGATMGDISRDAQIGPSAFYHHFDDKESLYEAVFDATVSHLWGLLDSSTRGQKSAAAALGGLIGAADRAREELPDYATYLSGLPSEAARHPRFRALLDRRIEAQRATFQHIAALGRATGEFDDTLGLEELSNTLRVVVMGWLVERNLHPDDELMSSRGLLHMLGLA